VADTNVLVAAAITPQGTCGRLVTAAIDGRWELVISPQLVEELATVLARPKFRRWLSEDEAKQFVDDVKALADVVPDPPLPTEQVTGDPKDEFVVAFAKVAGVVALVSGDPHLTELENMDPPVLTPGGFLEQLEARDL
jgi:uncharacterized protein